MTKIPITVTKSITFYIIIFCFLKKNTIKIYIKDCNFAFMKKLKERWDIESNFQLVIIFIVFSITGSLAAYLAKPVLELIHLSRTAFPEHFFGGFLYYSLRILLIFPIYQVLLILIGTIFGQHKFFWNFEKKMLSRLGLGFLFSKS